MPPDDFAPVGPMRRPTRRQWWLIVDGIAVAVVVGLLVLIGLHVLVLPPAAGPTVTVTSVTLNIVEGNDSYGWGWFGNSTRTLGANDGFPTQVGSGGTFTVPLNLPIQDNKNHTASGISAAPPFFVSETAPVLPSEIHLGDEDWQLTVTVLAPSVSSSQSETVTLTLVTE